MASAAALLLCDLVWADPVSQNHTILGVFTRLRASRVPTPLREMSVYALLVGEPGEAGEVVLSCVERTTGQDLYTEETRLMVGQSGKVHLHIRLGPFSFPTAGEYEFQLTFNGVPIADQVLEVLLKEGQS